MPLLLIAAGRELIACTRGDIRGRLDSSARLSRSPRVSSRLSDDDDRLAVSRHDSLGDDRVQVQHAATMTHRRVEIGFGHLVVSALRVEEDDLGDLAFLKSLSRSL